MRSESCSAANRVFRQVTFSRLHLARLTSCLLCALVVAVTAGCDHRSKEEKALRVELREALRAQSYEKAVELSRRVLRTSPHDEGIWDRLVTSQFALRDLVGVKTTLRDWRIAATKPSARLSEYTGDLAVEENDAPRALESWSKILAIDPKNLRVQEKVARLEHSQKHWKEENAAWTAAIRVRDNQTARINRALCARHLHHWADAMEDLRRARELGADDAEVARGAKLFARLEKLLPEIRELDARMVFSPQDAGLLSDRARLFLQGNDPELALEDSESAAKLAPWAVRPKLFAAIALIDLDRADECEKLAVQKFIRLDALTPELLETIGRLDSEISVEQDNADLYVSRAWQLNDISQPALAWQDAEKAALLDPKSAGACAESSYALMKLGRGDEAFERIKHATEIDANYSTAWQYRGELEMARADFLSAIDSLTRGLALNQTAIALEKREDCYRRVGLFVKAEQDHRALQEMNARALK